MKKNEMKEQIIVFISMIFYTLLAFVAIKGVFTKEFVVLFILLLAFVQFIFQVLYFMHGKGKEQEIPLFFLLTGVFMGLIIILGIVLLT